MEPAALLVANPGAKQKGGGELVGLWKRRAGRASGANSPAMQHDLVVVALDLAEICERIA
eukprot:1592224-Prymnesium_polylepis.1